MECQCTVHSAHVLFYFIFFFFSFRFVCLVRLYSFYVRKHFSAHKYELSSLLGLVACVSQSTRTFSSFFLVRCKNADFCMRLFQYTLFTIIVCHFTISLANCFHRVQMYSKTQAITLLVCWSGASVYWTFGSFFDAKAKRHELVNISKCEINRYLLFLPCHFTAKKVCTGK